MKKYAGLLLIMINLSLHATIYEVAQRDPKASDDGPGTSEQPWKTLTKAVAQAGPGDTVVIDGGVYREEVVATTSGTAQQPIRFEAAPGAHVVLTGADHLTGWQKGEGDREVYSIAWPYRFLTFYKSMAHPNDDYHRLIGRCEQVAVEGYLLRQVLEKSQLARGTFWVDISNQVLQVWDAANRNLNKVFVEGSARQQILRVEADYVEVRGLHFRFAADAAQQGAVVLAGAHDLLEDCVIEEMNALGANFVGKQQIVRRCVFRDNGDFGFAANHAHQLLFTECLVENNNIKDFDRQWGAGGDKLVFCRDAILERSQFMHNRGTGIWFDIGDEHCTVRQCFIADNEDAGIYCEISYGLQAHDNVIIGNGFAENPGAWGGQAGISLSSSPNCVIERNLIVGNREGFDFREQHRTTPRIGRERQEEVPVWVHDELIRHNLIAFNRDAQIWGWFGVKDNRHWPATGTNRIAGAVAVAKLGEPEREPKGLTLEALRLRFEENIYFAVPGQGYFEWGPLWGRHKNYLSLSAFQADLGIDTGSRVLDPGFLDMLTRDYRLSRHTMDKLKQSYPQGPVPECVLGVQR
jgi:parallel beta-helix repeat protein